MKTSVALCTYNGEAYLSSQLESILQQSISVREIIITDDNSQDKTILIIENFQERYPGIIKHYKNVPGLGAKKNFVKAISLCTGDIIFLSDQDDIWLPNKVETFLQHFNDNPTVEAVFSDGILIGDDDQPIGGTLFSRFNFATSVQAQWREDGILQHLTQEMNRITGATLAIRKELALRSLPYEFPSFMWHDLWLGLNAAVFNRLQWLDMPLIKYRIHAAQQVGIGSGTTVEQTITDGSLHSLISAWKMYEENWQYILKALMQRYNSELLAQIYQQKIDLIRFYEVRLNLPRNLLSRMVKVLSILPFYFQTKLKPLKSALRDIIKPA